MNNMETPKQEHRSRAETRAIILHLLSVSPRPLSRAEISRALRRQKSPHISAFIEELVEEGLLERSIKVYHNKAKGYVYQLRRK
jgi:predicted transcriptional regulator